MSQRTRKTFGVVAVVLLLALTTVVIGVAWLRQQQHIAPLQFEQRCVARVDGEQVVLTLDQAYYTAIITGSAVRRGLGEPGSTIAMATAYQETGIRNLEHGDRDSLGLFQQRPSQDWGTPAEIMDPWYSTNRFFDELVEIDGWQTGDVNDTAQAVQRSGHPQAYRQHERNARVLARAFTGAVPEAVSCFDERVRPGDPAGFRSGLRRTHGELPSRFDGQRLTLTADDAEHARALSAYAIVNAGRNGIVAVENGGRIWRADQGSLPSWQDDGTATADEVVIVFR